MLLCDELNLIKKMMKKHPPTPFKVEIFEYGFQSALENFQGQALRNCPVGNFSEGASLQGKRIISCLLRGA